MVLSLVISDVPGDRFDTVSSGPTAPDATTFEQARRVMEKYRIWKRVPASVRDVIRRGERGEVPETPKPRSPIFRKVHNVLIGSNRDARLATCAYLRKAGVETRLKDRFFQGEAAKTGESLVKEFLRWKPRKLSHPCALVAGGEATVKVHGSGVGGRDQELVLGAASFLAGEGLSSIAALATDGVDGPTNAAGAIADNTTIQRGRALGLSAAKALLNNDSNTYFRRLGSLLVCTPTGTNVNDVVIAMAFPQNQGRGREKH
jgi:glycerate-2-kinase